VIFGGDTIRRCVFFSLVESVIASAASSAAAHSTLSNMYCDSHVDFVEGKRHTLYAYWTVTGQLADKPTCGQ